MKSDILRTAEVTRLNTLHNHEVELNKVAVAINAASMQGRYSVVISMELSTIALDKLKDLGYKVSIDTDERFGTLTHISWKE